MRPRLPDIGAAPLGFSVVMAFVLSDRPFGVRARRLVAVLEDDPVAPGAHLRHDLLQSRLQGPDGVPDQLAHLLGESAPGTHAPVDIAIRVYGVPGVPR